MAGYVAGRRAPAKATFSGAFDLAQLGERLAGALERVARLRGVGHHLALEGLDLLELLLVADPADQRDVKRVPVQVAVEVEQEHLEQRRAVVEGRPPAEIG